MPKSNQYTQDSKPIFGGVWNRGDYNKRVIRNQIKNNMSLAPRVFLTNELGLCKVTWMAHMSIWVAIRIAWTTNRSAKRIQYKWEIKLG